MKVNFGISKQDWDKLDNLSTELYTAWKHNQVIDGSDECDIIRSIIGYDHTEYAVWEIPMDKLEELNVPVGKVYEADYDKLSNIKTGEYTCLNNLLELLNLSCEFTRQETSVYVLVDKTGKKVLTNN